jgi:hypothetical protein
MNSLIHRLPAARGAFAVLLIVLTAITPVDARAAEEKYVSLWAQTNKLRSDLERGSLLGDFHWAASAATLTSASKRWSSFLRTHAPAPGEEAEDAVQIRFVRIAKLELARVHYLSKRAREGDQIIKDMIKKP